MKLILASTSPFRKAILEKLDIAFETMSPDVDESVLVDEIPEQMVARLAEAKAKSVGKQISKALVIGSDQVALVDGQILGKPGTHENAVKQLRRASGKRISFLTGLCVYNTESKRTQLEVIPFNVIFRQLTDKQIENYLRKEQPYNCAGSFKSEGLGIALFERLEGDDPNTLIGLPLIRLIRMLESEGFPVI
ncbi:MAG: nucleoside triphosphate pyrophosphatase [Thioalkalispiraceae bacterium]|jgi:septum formation protein